MTALLSDTRQRQRLREQAHRERLRRGYPVIEADPELASAYRSLQLHWIARVPGYRDAIKAKLSEAAKQADARARKIEVNQMTAYGEKLGGVLKQQERDEQLQRLAGY